MRINKIQLAGLAVALAGGVGVTGAAAGDRTINTAETTPVETSLADGVSPGDVTVTTNGSITVQSGQSAITIDSNNDVSITGTGAISSADDSNTTGIRIEGGYTGNVNAGGTISALEAYVLDDIDDDGDVDGPWATTTNNHGIFLDNAGTHTGNIVHSGTMTIEGNSSSGITLDSLLTGDLTNTGSISVQGDNSVGIAINQGVTGDVTLSGNVVVRGENSDGLVIDGAIGGDLIINGTWTTSGYHAVSRPADISDLDADDLLQGGSAIVIRSSVAGGIVIDGVGVEDDEDDDDDGITEAQNDSNDDLTATIISYGAAPAMLIQADGSNIVLGATSTGYGLHIQGAITGSGVYDGIAGVGLRIEGIGGSTVTIADGIAMDGAVQGLGTNADSYAMVFGADTNVSELLIRRTLSSVVTSDLVRTAYGLVLESGANLPSLNNSGYMLAQVQGENGAAVTITDLSNTLSNITNSGSIIAQLVQTDSDLTDGIPPPAITGTATAIDLSASTIDVTLNQVADVAFTDEDAVDDDVNGRPSTLISGRILFGSGNDEINLNAGAILGDVEFGIGTDTFNINGGNYAGYIDDSDGALVINVQNGSLTHTGGTTNFTSATFGVDAILGVLIADVPADSTFLHASGTVTFDPDATIIPIVPDGLPDSGGYIFLTADGGFGGTDVNVVGPVSGTGSPWLYNLSISNVMGDPNSLQASYLRKTAAQLFMNSNQTAAYEPIIAALRLDDAAAAAIATLDTEDEFFDAYADLMPSYSSASTELAATAIQQAQSATTNRMAHTRLTGLDEVSVWVQEIGYAVNRTPSDTNAQEFDGTGFGLAAGIDGPLDNGAMFGLSASFLASEAEEPMRPDGEISSWFGQGNAYLGTALGPVDLDFVAGLGFGQMRSRRFVEIGTAYSAYTEADWWAYEGHGAIRASAPMALTNAIVVTPQAALTYVALSEQGYTENGGGDAIDLEADSSVSQRLWADVGVELSGRWTMRSGGIIAPRLYAGYRANAIDEAAERTFRFVSGGSDFTLTDESLGDGGPVVGIGLDATNGYSTFSLGYEGEFGDQIERHSLNAAIRFRF